MQHIGLTLGPTSFVGPPHSQDAQQEFRARKPYITSRPREKWTEEEHDLFVEALRLHGRQWPKIEEYIGAFEALVRNRAIRARSSRADRSFYRVGTKTAIQIRSHAQKYFAKQEKDDGE